MSISAGQVKELRDITGAGMMDCKAALAETGGDVEAAIDAVSIAVTQTSPSPWQP